MRSRNNDRTLAIASIASIATLVVLVVLLALAARDADAQPPVAHAEHAAMPTIDADSARAIVLARVAGATVTSERLRTRHGHELYLFTLAVAGRKSPVRATVDATSGAFTRLDGAADSSATTHPPATPATTTHPPAARPPAPGGR